LTYGGQGVGKAHVAKWKHGIVFTDQVSKGSKKKIVEPSPKPNELPADGESGMVSPIRVIAKSRSTKLDPMSRINYSKIYTVEHNVKVHDFGDVDENYHKKLLKQWKTVLFWDQKDQPSYENQSPATQATSQAQTTGPQVSYPMATTYGASGFAASTTTGYTVQSAPAAPGYAQGQYRVAYQVSTPYQSREEDQNYQYSSSGQG
jgi:hypothetical protein